MNKATILQDMSAEQITELFKGLHKEIADIKENFQPKQPNEYLTRAEVAEMLKVDLSTLHNWVKRGKLVPHCLGARVYFLRADVQSALIPIKK